jgi:polyhydroxyalkanoate synthesis regulator protein
LFWVKEFLGHKSVTSTQVYIHIERASYQNETSEDFHVKVANTKEDITHLLQTGFEYVLEKDGLAYFRKRK